MRRPEVLICLLGLMLNGCAAQHMVFVPPGVDGDQLEAVIAEHGQAPTSEPAVISEQPAQGQTRLDRAFQLGLEASPYVLTAPIWLPVLALYIVAAAHRGSGVSSSP